MADLGLRFWGGRRVPVVLQSEQADCGLACMAMIVGFHGAETDLRTLRAKFSSSLRGVTVTDLIHIGSRMQLAGRALRLEPEDLSELALPCILHWDMSHFVVLKRVTRKYAYITDPAMGPRRLPFAKLAKHFTGVALELVPTEDFKQEEKKERIKVRQLFGRVVGFRRALAQVLMFALALEVLALIAPLQTQWLVDNALVSGDRGLVTALGIGFLMLAMVNITISTARSWVVMYLGTTLSYAWQVRVFSHVMKLPMDYFEKRSLGDVMSRFHSIDNIQGTISSVFIEVILDGLVAIGTAIVMFIYSPVLSMVAIAAVLLYFTVQAIMYQPQYDATNESIIAGANLTSFFLETLRGMQPIKLFAREDERRSRYMDNLSTSLNRGVKVQRYGLMGGLANSMLSSIEGVVALWIGALLVMDGHLSLGMLFAFLSYKSQFTGRTMALIGHAFKLRFLRLELERLSDIVLTAPEKHAVDPMPLPAGLSLQLEDVSFRYSDNEPYVLRHCSLNIQAGESVALVGRTGCGKTTLVKLMMSLLVPTEGKILVNGIEMGRLDLVAYRRAVGTVMQDDQLFTGSLAENISFFEPGADRLRIAECAEIAHVHDDIMAFPMGYESLVGDMGSTLSGGQKQRVMLARALYKAPRLLVLDEATSHLDVESERRVSAALKRLNIAKIMVAHRPETIASADRVIEIFEGAAREIPHAAVGPKHFVAPEAKPEPEPVF
jgi:ATP-binding cassette subfamily B protein RaxB